MHGCRRVARVDTRKRVKLFAVGVVIGMSMFFIGGIGVVPAHSTQEPTAQLQPWLQKTVCDYPNVDDCTSQGSVVTSPAVQHGPN
jgi:hypothetical protein